MSYLCTTKLLGYHGLLVYQIRKYLQKEKTLKTKLRTSNDMLAIEIGRCEQNPK